MPWRVILASRYGTWFPRRWGSESARMTLPRASKPVLMWTDSLRRRPVFPVRAARSDPARSTRWSLEKRTEPSSWLLGPVCLRALPASRTLCNSSAEVITVSLAPTTTETH
uniref:Uncharacterized protein n=1 Tax=Oncorhynchus tshawytscha TaxID=74940 RepID=A0A8C8H1L3_ONCTS